MKQFYYTILTLIRGRGSNVIKVISLTLGLLVSIILFSRVAFELSYDNFFQDVDDLYIVKTEWVENGVIKGNAGVYTLIPVASTIAEEFPEEVESAAFSSLSFGTTLKIGNRKLNRSFILSDSLYFHTMGIEVINGNPNDLTNPDVIFLSQSVAREVFGEEDPIGKTLHLMVWGTQVEALVRGVYADLPDNVSLERPEIVLSFASHNKYGWGRPGWTSGGNYKAFVRLKDGERSADVINAGIDKVIAKHIPPEMNLHLHMFVVPLRTIHLEQSNVRKTILIMSLLGFAILFAATMNYVLISISSLSHRAKGIGVHKCNGASDKAILSMFIYETALIIGISLLFMVVLLFQFQEKIEELAGVSLSSLFTWHNLWAPLSVVAFLFVIGGVLPGKVFSSIPVTQVFHHYTKGNMGWKRTLLFIEFAGVAFIFGLMCVTFFQFHYITNRDMGYRPERVASCWHEFAEPDNARNNLKSLPYVEGVATAEGSMIGLRNRQVTDENGNALFIPRCGIFDKDFVPLMGLRLKAGQNLTGERQFLVNQPYVEKMGWTGSGVGEIIPNRGTVVGILAPFCFGTLPPDDEPIEIECGTNLVNMHVRLKEPFADNLRMLNNEMKKIYPQEEIEFTSLERALERGYRPTMIFRDTTILAFITILFITLMGLIGYTNDEVRRRGKEIAIRKINGAEVSSVLLLLSKDIFWVAIPSIAIGTYGAYLVSQIWISQFRDTVCISIGWYVAIAICLLAFIIICIIGKSWHIANENPVNSIKSE